MDNGIRRSPHRLSRTTKFFEQRIRKLQIPDSGSAEPVKWWDNEAHTIVFQPAMIEQPDGTYKSFFPGPTEELIEEVLKKILADQNYGIHDPNKQETWVKFSLSMIARELKEMGHQRNLRYIKQSIEVLSGSVITILKGKKRFGKALFCKISLRLIERNI